MAKENAGSPAPNQEQIVFVIVRWGKIEGVYKKHEDAAAVQSYFISKGQLCDLSAQPVKETNFLNR